VAHVLIIDDDQMFCEMLAHKVELLGHQAAFAHSLTQGLALCQSGGYDVIYLDVRMPDGNGLEWLGRIQASPGRPEVIIMTGAGDPDGAELAIKSGAWDYVKKPSSMQATTLPLARALQYRQEKAAAGQRRALRLEGIVGADPAFAACLDKLAQAAGSEAAVLICGETGTGKELFARAIHENSARHGGSFVVVDCSVLPQNLVESILFGHEKGAFTGASEARRGLIAQANGGTLFLDEVGELSPALQRSFLRVLQERRFRPLGAARESSSDFRLLAATNRDLEAMAAGGAFREDLLFRLRTLVIDLPPLRRRGKDIASLVSHHLELLCRRYGQGAKGFSPEFMAALTAHAWPGNVRELVSALEQALAAAGPAPTLHVHHLPQKLRIALARASAHPLEAAPRQPEEAAPAPGLPPLKQYRQAMDRQYLQELLRACQGDMGRAVAVSGLSRSRLYALLKQLGLARQG